MDENSTAFWKTILDKIIDKIIDNNESHTYKKNQIMKKVLACFMIVVMTRI
jgi:hypothetical protein